MLGIEKQGSIMVVQKLTIQGRWGLEKSKHSGVYLGTHQEQEKPVLWGLKKSKHPRVYLGTHQEQKKSVLWGGGGKPFFFLTIIKTYFKVNIYI